MNHQIDMPTAGDTEYCKAVDKDLHSIMSLQQETPAAARALFCEHCVSGGRYGPDFKHLLDDEPFEKPPELTPEQAAENVRRLEKADIRNDYRRRRTDRKLKRGY